MTTASIKKLAKKILKNYNHDVLIKDMELLEQTTKTIYVEEYSLDFLSFKIEDTSTGAVYLISEDTYDWGVEVVKRGREVEI